MFILIDEFLNRGCVYSSLRNRVYPIKDAALKVSQSQKQIMASWILPKNERWGILQYIKMPQARFLEESRKTYCFFRDYLTFSIALAMGASILCELLR